ncbi:Immunity protein 35 [Rheinheimera pacifica]|uniref:Immunity protein 35 n=1 Tax=Rheinheimera pacifica TaxID=173990 RepID=A0A1H6NG04_9GAMM|nr:YrhB domain-containing protein [Rheinheimera pacifica]SEI09118.1 Immunity protein 35 [Rheinheimera pacifica]
MVTKEVAHKLVAEAVGGEFDWLPEGDEIIIIERNTIEKPWGWVIFHTSKLWLETNDIKYAIAGNAPTIVERETGKLITTGTAMSIDKYIENYERTGTPHA